MTRPKAGENTTKVSSPGQIFLFGEHAVVYGEPALAAAIGVRTEVVAEDLDGNDFRVISEGIGELEGEIRLKDGKYSVENKEGSTQKLNFVTEAAELTMNYLGKGDGISLNISSDLPVGSGLGSSSAVTTATVASLSSFLGEKLSKGEISDLAYETEVQVQGVASRTGVSVATHGGFNRIEEDRIDELRGLPELELLIGYTGKYANTGELVEGVRKLREDRPEVVNSIIETIGEITESGISTLEEGNLEKVGVLMNADQNLLEGLGVSSPELRELLEASLDSGALGAKLTGAGGGGCMIALGSGNRNKIAEAIENKGGEPIKTRVGVEGLRYIGSE